MVAQAPHEAGEDLSGDVLADLAGDLGEEDDRAGGRGDQPGARLPPDEVAGGGPGGGPGRRQGGTRGCDWALPCAAASAAPPQAARHAAAIAGRSPALSTPWATATAMRM